jgi:hypothetical protein
MTCILNSFSPKAQVIYISQIALNNLNLLASWFGCVNFTKRAMVQVCVNKNSNLSNLTLQIRELAKLRLGKYTYLKTNPFKHIKKMFPIIPYFPKI